MDDKELLKIFFIELKKYLFDFVLERRRILFTGREFENERLRDLVTSAWIEIDKDYDSIYNAIDEANAEQLRTLGLAGAQLQLKTGVFFESIYGIGGRYREDSSDGGKRIVKKALGYGKILVGTAAAMTGAAEPVKEFIELAHNAIDSNT